MVSGSRYILVFLENIVSFLRIAYKRNRGNQYTLPQIPANLVMTTPLTKIQNNLVSVSSLFASTTNKSQSRLRTRAFSLNIKHKYLTH